MGKKYDHVFVDGKIFTADDTQPYAEAMAVKDGRIAWIGSTADLNLEGESVVSLHGKRVIPGFVDPHFHPFMFADTFKQIPCLPPVVNSIEEMVAAIRDVREKKGPVGWIEGWGYDEGKFSEKRTPNRHDLDRGASDVPVSIIRTCCHIRCVNSKALEMAGIDRNTPDPSGGKIDRDENGEPTGILRENAREAMDHILPAFSIDKTIENLIDMNKLLLSQGIVAIADIGNFNDVDTYSVFKEVEKRGFLPRVSAFIFWDDIKKDDAFTLTPEQMAPNARVRIAGVKLIGDGSVSGRTAWCDQPYLGSTDNFGFPVCTEEEMRDAMAFAKKNRCQISIHGMGTPAIDRAIDAACSEEGWMEDGIPSVRVEHVAMPTAQAIEKAARHGVAFVTQPAFLFAEIESYLTNLGPERTRKTYPIADMLKAGVKLSFSTDTPATAWANPSDPFIVLKAAVTRRAYDGTDCGQEHRVDIETALKLYTASAAPMLGYTDIGRLAEGFSADFAVLDRDILAVPAEEIDQVKVDETYINGNRVFNRLEQ